MSMGGNRTGTGGNSNFASAGVNPRDMARPVPHEIAEQGWLLYLYAVLPQGTSAEALLDQGRVAGVHAPEPLFAVRAQGLTAAVSRVPATEFQENALDRLLRDVALVGPYALRHDEAIRSLMAETPALIPLAFGTVYVSSEGIGRLLETNAEPFRALLGDLAGKQEWTLKVFTDSERAKGLAEQTSAEARRLAQEAAAASPGRRYLVQKQRAQAMGQETARLQAESMGKVLDDVRGLATALRLDDLPQQDPSTQVLALKAALLVETRRQDELRTTVSALQDEHAPAGLGLEITGPWPPYSFVGTR